jgi:hypothetical protein
MDNILTIQKTFYKVADFISWTKKKGLILSPYFQRRPVWNKGAKSYLMDTIYKGLPIPIIFLRDRGIDKKTYEPIREVIDGQQRLRTIISFIAPDLLQDFKSASDDFLVNKTHNIDLAGKKFTELDEYSQDRILNYEFNVHILPSNVDDRDVIQIFRRMNSTNYTLKKQELLNAQFFGEFKTSQYNLAAEQLERWRGWKTFTEDEIARMQEVELTSELSISIIEGSILGKSSAQIENYYKRKDEKYDEREEVEKRIRDTLNFIYQNFLGNKNDFVFFKKTIFYTFFIACYDLLYGLNASSTMPKIANKIAQTTVNDLKVKGDRIRERTAPSNVLEATDRRTTNPKERKDLFNYLKV